MSANSTGPFRSLPSPIVFGCAGTVLTPAERILFTSVNPLGLILFARNIADPDQVRALVNDFRSIVARVDAPVLIDQEGGRVARLRPPYWPEFPALARFGELWQQNPDGATEATRLNGRLLAAVLMDLGIDVDCAPVLDIPIPGSHAVIGDRAFALDTGVVATLGRALAEGMMAGGVLPVMKHTPGHGRARADSHIELPQVTTSRAELSATDFLPFALLRDLPWAMTAHILYRDIDDQRCATVSPRVIGEVIRGEIGFDGVLISDDLSMQALGGSLPDRALAAIAAGCDLALHCSGKLDEMEAIANVLPPMTPAALVRIARSSAQRHHPTGVDVAKATKRRDKLLLSVQRKNTA